MKHKTPTLSKGFSVARVLVLVLRWCRASSGGNVVVLVPVLALVLVLALVPVRPDLRVVRRAGTNF